MLLPCTVLFPDRIEIALALFAGFPANELLVSVDVLLAPSDSYA